MRAYVTARLKGTELFGHPIGLYALFMTEMWERFSYYGMRALLVLYMTDYLLSDPARAERVLGMDGLAALLAKVFGPLTVQQLSSQIYGLYTGFVYFTPLLGGLLADRILGRYRTVYLGCVLMAIGHFLMASEALFLLALIVLVLGNGCFKPNITTQVGDLYPEGDPRRDSAYTIFYMGVNTGAFLSPLVCGTLGQVVGWHWGFGAAGVGMVVGLFIYWLGSGLVPRSASAQPANSAARAAETKQPLTRGEWQALAALVVLCALNITFWAVYEQQGNTLQLWADKRTDWTVLGFNLPSTWYQSFNPVMIVLFAPLLTAFWAWRTRRGRPSTSIGKIALGSVLLGLGYIGMVLAARVVPEGQRGGLHWLVSTTAVFTIGELYFSPVGLSLVNKVAPARLASTMMGFWYLSSFFGNYLTGYLGTFYDTMPKDRFFLMLTLIAVATGGTIMLLRRPLERAIGRRV